MSPSFFKKSLLIFILLVIIVSTGCRKKFPYENISPRLSKVKELLDSHSDSIEITAIAFRNLQHIPLSNLNKKEERMLLRLLLIKSKDKLSLPIDRETGIDSVISFFSAYPYSSLYIESLYYGGRVWHERGNLQQGLEFYKSALKGCEKDLTDESEVWKQDIKGRILSNISAILFSERKFMESRPFLKESIALDRHLKDSLGLMFDYKQLAISYLKENEYDSARQYLRLANTIASQVRPSFQSTIDIYQAEADYSEGKIESALGIIRPLPGQVDSIARNTALNLASLIYLKACIPDTAYIFARELALSKNPSNRHNGLQLMASEDLRRYIPQDSLGYWLGEYGQCMEEFAKSMKTREKTSSFPDLPSMSTSSFRRIDLLLLAGLFLILLLSIVIYYELNPRLHHPADHNASPSPALTGTLDSTTTSKALFKMIYEKKGLSEENELWNDMEKEINRYYPSFFERLQTLSIKPLTTRDFRLVMLIKYGVTPTQTGILFVKEKGTISHYRRILREHLFGEPTTIVDIDSKIRDI